MSKFDAVWRQKADGTYKQAFADLAAVPGDCQVLGQCLEKYQIKTKNVYNLSNNPTKGEVERGIAQLSARLRAGKKKRPMERYLIIFLFAGHGLQKEGAQVMLYNEYDPAKHFYKLFRAEAKLRSFAEIY